MNSKSIALVIVFAGIAIALNVIRIPTIFYPGTYFQFSQIPIIVAFLLFGVKVGVFVGLLNLVGGLALFPLGPVGFIVYPADFLSSLTMILGILLVSRLINNRNESLKGPFFRKPAIGLTLGAVVFRTGIMPFFDFIVVYHIFLPLILGIKLSEAYVLGLVPAFILYNAVVALYIVSVAHVVTTKVSKPLKIKNQYLA